MITDWIPHKSERTELEIKRGLRERRLQALDRLANHGGADGLGGAGVREPRRPLPPTRATGYAEPLPQQ